MATPLDPARQNSARARQGGADLPVEVRRRLPELDPEALGQLYDTFFERVYAFVHRLLREEHLAEDVTQDIFLHLYRSLDSYDPARELRPWIFTIAANKVRDHWRSRRHREGLREASVEDDAGAEPVVAPERGPAERIEAGEVSELVASAIDDMPEIMRTTLVLRYYEGLSFTEIGGIVDRNETAVRKRYSRALAELRGRLEGVLDLPGGEAAPTTR